MSPNTGSQEAHGQEQQVQSARAVCSDCRATLPAYMVGSSGVCFECHVINEIGRVCGLANYQRREKYRHDRYDGTILLGNATRKPKVAPGAVPPHWLDMTPVRLSEMDLPSGFAPPNPRAWLPFAARE